MLRIEQVTADYLVNPVGISRSPQLSWMIGSDKFNVIQKSYRLQVASDPSFQPLLFDSGIVESEQSAHVEVKDLKLISSTTYYWRVKISDGEEESEWSQTASFATALLTHEEWRGQFVSAETKADADNSKGTYVRREFSAKPGIARAVVYSTALGLYQLYLNGKRVGDDELAPGWTSYKKHLLYQTHDVTHLIQSGGNAIGAMLGAGWYKGLMGFSGQRNHYGDQTALLCQLEIAYTDGTKDVLATDREWKGADSPVLFSEIYDGETYDARLEEEGWCSPGYNDAAWRSVDILEYDKSALASQAGGKIKEIDRIPAKKLIITPQGDKVIDFGQNLTGWVRFNAKGQAGDRVVLKHFEVLDAEGNVYLDNLRKAKQTIDYTLKGGEAEAYHPHFTFHGFQYVHVVEYPGELNLEDIEAVAVHSEMKPAGTFECSNKDVNQLQHNILWGMKGNFLDVPTDCPQRDERMGWTGDAQIFCRTATYLMDTYTFFGKWLKDVKADQTPEGGVPHVVPDIVSGKAEGNWLLKQGTHSAAAWADVAVIAPWTLYLMYGDTRILEDQYDSMKAWIDFMEQHSENGIWNYKLQFGDWVALDAKEGSYFGATPNDLVATAYYAYSTELFSKIAKVLGKEQDYDKYSKLYREVVDTFHNEFFTPRGRMAARTQTAHIVALYFNLVPDEFKQRTIDTLVELLEENGGHLVTGFVGTPYFCHALSQNGRLKEAYELLLKDDFPSWLYQVKAGATTIWEHWDGIKPDGTMWSPNMNSFNHYAYGAVGEWLFRVAAGIEADEHKAGFKHAVIQPHIGGGLDYVNATYSTVYGDIAVSWKAKGNRVDLEVSVPHNTTATIVLGQAESVVSELEGQFVRSDKGLAAQVGSGQYSYSYFIN